MPCFLRGLHGLLSGTHGLQLLLSGLVAGPQLLYGRKVRARRSKLAQVAMQATPAFGSSSGKQRSPAEVTLPRLTSTVLRLSGVLNKIAA